MKAEDSQPNETRTALKGGNIPTVQRTFPSKPPTISSRSRYQTTQRQKGQRYANGYGYMEVANIRDPGQKLFTETGSERRVESKGNERYGRKRDKTSYTPFRPMTTLACGVKNGCRSFGKAPGGTQYTGLTDFKRQNVDRNEEPVRETHSITYDVPDNCKGEGRRIRDRRRLFISNSLKDIEKRFDARIHSHQVSNGKLSIVYSYLDFEMPLHRASYSDMKSSNDNMALGSSVKKKVATYSSGSHIKLEDMEGRFDSEAPIDSYGEGTSATLVKSHDQTENSSARPTSPFDSPAIKMNNIPYRPFRCNTLQLTLIPDHTTGFEPVAALDAHSNDSEEETFVVGDIGTDHCEPSDVELLIQSEPDYPRRSPILDSVGIGMSGLPSPSSTCANDSSHHIHDDGAPVESGTSLDFFPCIRVDEAGEELLALSQRDEQDKPRRLLISGRRGCSYLVCKHATVREVSQTSPRHQRNIYRRSTLSSALVEDACFLPYLDGDIVVLARSEDENALSLLFTAEDKRGSPVSLKRPSKDIERRRQGASAVTPLLHSPFTFVSGGYDHIVHLWTFNPSSGPLTSECRPLDIKHRATVQSILSTEDTSPKLLTAGADCCVNVWDLLSDRLLRTIRTSNSVYQLHRTHRPECALLEVAHRDSQFELHDYRTSSGAPVSRFGFHTTQLQGRYAKGDVKIRSGSCMFVSGSRDGHLRLWDLRNTRRCAQQISCIPDQRIVHAAFDDTTVAALSADNRILFYDTM